jgi:hypothetical protein
MKFPTLKPWFQAYLNQPLPSTTFHSLRHYGGSGESGSVVLTVGKPPASRTRVSVRISGGERLETAQSICILNGEYLLLCHRR